VIVILHKLLSIQLNFKLFFNLSIFASEHYKRKEKKRKIKKSLMCFGWS